MAENKKQDQPPVGQMDHQSSYAETSEKRIVPGLSNPGLSRRIAFALEYKRDRFVQVLQQTFYYELDRGIAFHLVPVLIGLGIILYFSAPAEPFAPLLAMMSILTGVAVIKSKGTTVLYRFLICMFLLMVGMLSAKYAVFQSQHPTIPNQITGEMTGTIIAVDENRRGAPRYVIAPDGIEGVSNTELPRYVRLSAAGKGTAFEPGQRLTGLARLQAVLGPVYPGGYDFSFFSRFSGIGGSGFFMGKPALAPATDRRINFGDRIKININLLRSVIKKRIQTALPGDTGKIATALVIGDKSGIPSDAQDALRATGLAHILAISGLHMALVALTTLWVLRLLLSLNSRLALHFPIKKWAAIGAFVMATAYLMISGFGVATQRAWIMLCVMLAAMLLDRRAITLRNVAISAIIILFLDPSSVMAPGFQMSFAAVIALVSAYEAINRKRRERLAEQPFKQRGLVSSALFNLGTFTGGLFTTSLVAGVATSFIAAWHFHQVPPLGLLANLLAMPLVTVLVMPAVLFSIVLIPFGLDPWSLILVSRGIEVILEIAFWVNGLMPVVATGIQAVATFMLFIVGFAVLTLLKSRLRLMGIAIFAIVPGFASKPVIPDVMIAENGRSIAVKQAEGDLVTLMPRRANFVTNIWGKAYAKTKIRPAELEPEQCNRERCIYHFENGVQFYLVYAPDLLQNACENADILAAPRLKWVNCRERTPQIVLKREDFESKGAHEVYFVEKQSDNHSALLLNAKPDKQPVDKPIDMIVKTAFGPAKRPWHRQPVTYQDY